MTEAKKKDQLFDAFSRNTRLKPALLVVLPISGAVAAVGLSYSVAMGAVTAPLTAAGATFLLAQLGRDFGLRRQPYLFNRWGGKPSTTMLRHRDGRLNAITLGRYHAKAAKLLGRLTPTAQQEESDTKSADVVYEAYGDLLREKTRDKEAYPLLFQELMNYNFRRNLWGMKAIGISIATTSIAIQAGLAVVALTGKIERPGAADMAVLLVDVFMLACWLFLITPSWVRIAADAYAERLLAASEKL